jgi:hypothetical protein
VNIADSVRLFVLDDGGVLFVGHTQELCTLNAAGTFIWCCIEEGLTAEQITAAYCRSFTVATVQGERHVASALAQWQGLGYIDGYAIPSGFEQPLLQALARLLVDETLRIEFEAAPNRVAARLGIGGEDLGDFLALDPEALRQQAQLEAARQIQNRGVSSTTSAKVFSAICNDGTSVLSAVAAAALLHASEPAITSRYRMLETRICMRYGSTAQAERIAPVVAHLACDGCEPIDCVFDFVELEAGHVMLVDGVPVEYCPDLESLAPIVKNTLRRIATDRYCFLLEIHAGVVAVGEHCILFPGAPGQGKTTLTAALSCSGFRYFSDEVALLEEPNFAVRSVPLSLGIKPGAVDVLAPLYPEVRDLFVHAREDEQRVRYLSPPGYREDLPNSLPVRWIVFPTYDANSETRLEPLSRAEALWRLLVECFSLPELLDEARVYALVQWLRGVECWALPLSSLAAGVELIQGLCGVTPTPGVRAS